MLTPVAAGQLLSRGVGQVRTWSSPSPARASGPMALPSDLLALANPAPLSVGTPGSQRKEKTERRKVKRPRGLVLVKPAP